MIERIIASIIFFTRLPLWKLKNPSREAYTHVVEFWPLTGWITAITMGGTMWLASHVFPWTVSIILGLLSRIILTGALHEDGLADFCDGFGAGGDRQRTLDIMKDSHIGTYGVVGLIIYYLLLFCIFLQFMPTEAFFLILAGDPFAKMLSGQIVQMLPYARTMEQSKAKNIYAHISTFSAILITIQALIPISISYIYLCHLSHHVYLYYWVMAIPCLTMYFMYRLMRNRLQGYTGDCCGAMFLMVELSFYLSLLM